MSKPNLNFSFSGDKKPDFPTFKEYRTHIRKDKTCNCHIWKRAVHKPVLLKNLPIQHYDHDGGYNVYGFKKRQWLYVTCPECGYEWNLSKLGIPKTFGENDSVESQLYYKRYMKYRDECYTINPDTGCYKCSPKCPQITVNGKPFCLLNDYQCNVRAMAGSVCPPFMHYDEAKRKADLWVDI